jgi:cation diffusion facilitator family transporter
MACTSSSKKVVYAALFGNLAIAVTKFAAALYTGSSAMLSEAGHSVVDTGNELLLLYGMRRASRPPDEAHPFGFGRELYFWSFIVALLVFALGAGVSLYQGIAHLRHPTPIENPIVVYVVLGLSALFEGASWRVALREFRAAKGDIGYFEAVRRSKDPSTFIVLFEDSAALLGLAIAGLGTAASVAFEAPALDGAASIGIGLVLAATSAILARESKGLLLGEGAHPEIARSIRLIAAEEPGIERVNGLLTVQMGPSQIVAALSVEFADDLTAGDIEAAVAGVERRLQEAHPELVTVFVKPQTPSLFREVRERRYGRGS